MRSDFFKSQDTIRHWGWDGPRRDLGLLPAKKTTKGCFRDYYARQYPLKTLNRQRNTIMGRPRGCELTKVLGMIKSFPFKASTPPRVGWPQDDLGRHGLSPLD
jgi:hypothetical protein